MYFSGMLRDVGHVVRMHSAFPARVVVQGKRRLLFCIQTEYVEAGSVRDMCEQGFPPWTEE